MAKEPEYDWNGSEKTVITTTQYSKLIPEILEDCLYNIIHDIVLDVHRTEKRLRMTSVAVQAEKLALQASGQPPTPTTSNPTPTKPGLPPAQAPQIKIDVPGGYYENGRVYLKGNPLKQIKDIYCPHCKLPRLLFPIKGAGAKLPDDPNPNRQYCTLHPFISLPGHDIYGNPFPIDQTNKTKREREQIKKQEKAERDNTPGSQGTNDDGMTVDTFAKRLLAGGKPASYVPWHTCPQCKRSLLITKFAQHLEKCLGIGGRTARNTAAARLSGMNGSANGSVQGSRVGTPTPSQGNGNGNGKKENDEEEDEGPPKKKSKKDGTRKEKKGEGGKEKVTIKLGGTKSKPDAAKRPPKGSAPTSNPEKKNDDTPTSKRERETADSDESPQKKKIKKSTDDGADSN
ncbi:putative transcriptional activator protein [Venturia nashicola]|uniref:SAGA-associated factor 11 n=1 Tax=Venturia nashicola TaxID=86259 RepID=A0A4Z1NNB0_9PEZI|nr:putative transcriptional activator protein [Venturia nashicola]TLD23627.1 putative transcriptional activator protein [Venturia nashicola]